ncbi:MAG: T9SS type A sorting domain-containing protein [Bacteroidia bacterium]|nr:T9SS type A sorting domain-containing protein [Bacteroidia bacterium]
MRKLLLTLASAVAVGTTMTAQSPYSIPNAGFENWITTGTNAGKAQNWAGFGDMAVLQGAPSFSLLTTYFRDNVNKNSGNSSIKIQNQNFVFPPIGDIPGVAWLGTAGTSTANMGIYGIPFSQNIVAFGGHFRYSISSPTSKDTAVIICQTSKWTGTTSNLIQDASIMVNSNISAFQNIIQNASTATPGVPDTLWILAFSSYWPFTDSIPQASSGYASTLNMDDLTLTVTTGITAPVLDFVDTRIAPNPATDMVRFTTSSKNIGGYFRLYDALGKEVLSVLVTNALDNKFSVEALPAGIYFYQVSNNNGDVNAHGKLIVTK